MSYDDIIRLPHHTSPTRPRMPMADRAAQFAPFAALSGYEEVIAETGRLTEAEITPDESQMERIGRKLADLKTHLEEQPMLCARIFYPDGKKAGGAYHRVQQRVRKIDEFQQKITLEDGQTLFFSQIVEIF